MTKKLFLQWMMVAILICGLSVLASCSSDNDDNNGGSEYKGVPLVILDTDIGSSTDDLFALEMLYRYEDEGRCKLLGLVVNREGEKYPALADVMNERGGVKDPKVFINYEDLPNHQTDDGKPMFKRTISDYSTLPNGWQLYRKLLAEQPDHSVSICSIGFVSSIDQLLASEPDDISPLTGIELVRNKVKCLYLMAGVFTSSEEPDYNFLQDPTYARLLFRMSTFTQCRFLHPARSTCPTNTSLSQQAKRTTSIKWQLLMTALLLLTLTQICRNTLMSRYTPALTITGSLLALTMRLRHSQKRLMFRSMTFQITKKSFCRDM